MSINSIIENLDDKAKPLLLKKANRAREIAETLHMTAPRDSNYKNSKGLNRSATLAAPDTGKLLSIINTQPQELPDGWRVGLNYGFLEYGPLKRTILALTKQQLKNEGAR